MAVLARSQADGTQAATADGSALLKAKLLAQAGRSQEALATLAPIQGMDAVELQATIGEAARDWPGAAQALRALSATSGLPSSPAAVKQQAVLRAVRDAGEASDKADWRDLHARLASPFTGAD